MTLIAGEAQEIVPELDLSGDRLRLSKTKFNEKVTT